MMIFDNLTPVPDMSEVEYDDYVAAIEAKKKREGYSQFLAALMNQSAISVESLIETVDLMVNNLRGNSENKDKILLCEEYVEHLKTIIFSSPESLKGAVEGGNGEWLNKLKDEKLRSRNPGLPGMSMISKIGLMNVVDFVNRGWKKK